MGSAEPRGRIVVVVVMTEIEMFRKITMFVTSNLIAIQLARIVPTNSHHFVTMLVVCQCNLCS